MPAIARPLANARCTLAGILVILATCVLLSQTVVLADEPAEPRLAGTVRDEAGLPVAGAEVQLLRSVTPLKTTTDERGQFHFEIAPQAAHHETILAQSADGSLQRIVPHYEPGPLELTLAPLRQVTVIVRDGADRPLADAQVAAIRYERTPYLSAKTDEHGQATLAIAAGADVTTIIAAKPAAGFNYFSTLTSQHATTRNPLPDEIVLRLSDPLSVTIRAVDSAGNPLAGVEVAPSRVTCAGQPQGVDFRREFNAFEQVTQTTDAAGLATFDWLPSQFQYSLPFQIHRDGYHVSEPVQLLADKPISQLTTTLLRFSSLAGRVLHADGTPAAGITLRGEGQSSTNRGGAHAETQADGTFECRVQSEMAYALWVVDKRWAAAPISGIIVRENAPVGGLEFSLVPATTVRGRVTVGQAATPVSDATIQLSMLLGEIPAVLKKPEDRYHRALFQGHNARTDADGRYAFQVGPGTFNLRGPGQTEPVELTVGDAGGEITRDFHLPRPETMPLTGQVVDAQGLPISGAMVWGVYAASIYRSDPRAVTDEHGRFRLERATCKTAFHARTADGTQAGLTWADEETAELTIQLGPTASVTGILLDADGRPLPDGKVITGMRIYQGGPNNSPWRTAFGATVTADADARFVCEGLLPGQPYELSYRHEDELRYSTLAQITLEPHEQRDVGQVRLAKPYRSPTLAERTAKLFGNRTPLAERLTNATADAQHGSVRVVILLGDKQSPASQKLTELRGNDWLSALNHYEQVAVSTDDTLAVSDLKSRFGVAAAEFHAPALVALDEQGQFLATLQLPDDAVELAQQTPTVQAFLQQHAAPALDAIEVMQAALDQARRENKRVFVQQTATWCGPCKLLTRFIAQHKPVFDENYVYVKIDSERYKHGDQIMTALRKGRGGGIPWSVILDADGNELGALTLADDQNIGFPSSAESVAVFLKLLEATAPRITPQQLDELQAALLPQDTTPQK